MKNSIKNSRTQKDQIKDAKIYKDYKVKNSSGIDFDDIFQVSSEKVTKIFKISNTMPNNLPYDKILSSM